MYSTHSPALVAIAAMSGYTDAACGESSRSAQDRIPSRTTRLRTICFRLYLGVLLGLAGLNLLASTGMQ